MTWWDDFALLCTGNEHVWRAGVDARESGPTCSSGESDCCCPSLLSAPVCAKLFIGFISSDFSAAPRLFSFSKADC